MTAVSEAEIAAVLKLDGPARLARFVKVVADSEQAWGLWDDGWALFEDDDGKQVFPVWPSQAYANLCREPDWTNYSPAPIDVHDLVDELLPMLGEQGILVGVFPTPSGQGVTPDPGHLESMIREELSQYE